MHEENSTFLHQRTQHNVSKPIHGCSAAGVTDTSDSAPVTTASTAALVTADCATADAMERLRDVGGDDFLGQPQSGRYVVVVASEHSQKTAGLSGGDLSRPWSDLASDYEHARAKEDSLDRLVEWPAERDLLGDVNGMSLLDAGCGNGGKIAELTEEGGAVASVGVDISGNFIATQPAGLELIQGDLSDLASVPGLAERRFDRILFLQSFGYAKDPVGALRTARGMLADDGFVLLTRTQPIRYAIERAEQNDTSLGEEYFSTESFSYLHKGWNEDVQLTKRPYTMSDLLNVFSAAGLWIETAAEPQMAEEVRIRYPHKQAVLNKYLGILIFKLRPLPTRVP